MCSLKLSSKISFKILERIHQFQKPLNVVRLLLGLQHQKSEQEIQVNFHKYLRCNTFTQPNQHNIHSHTPTHVMFSSFLYFKDFSFYMLLLLFFFFRCRFPPRNMCYRNWKTILFPNKHKKLNDTMKESHPGPGCT